MRCSGCNASFAHSCLCQPTAGDANTLERWFQANTHTHSVNCQMLDNGSAARLAIRLKGGGTLMLCQYYVEWQLSHRWAAKNYICCKSRVFFVSTFVHKDLPQWWTSCVRGLAVVNGSNPCDRANFTWGTKKQAHSSGWLTVVFRVFDIMPANDISIGHPTCWLAYRTLFKGQQCSIIYRLFAPCGWCRLENFLTTSCEILPQLERLSEQVVKEKIVCC